VEGALALRMISMMSVARVSQAEDGTTNSTQTYNTHAPHPTAKPTLTNQCVSYALKNSL